MMLVLAVRTDAERVYERALRFFTPDEIAEAFAAARGVASPTQLRTVMKQDGRDLLAQFRALAPPTAPDRAAAVERQAGRADPGPRSSALCSSARRSSSAAHCRQLDTSDVDGTPDVRHRTT